MKIVVLVDFEGSCFPSVPDNPGLTAARKARGQGGVKILIKAEKLVRQSHFRITFALLAHD